MKLSVLIITALFLPSLSFTQSVADSMNSAKQNVIRKQQFKINLLPTFGGRVDISWEKGVKTNSSYDLGLNFIGVTSKNKYVPQGVIAHVGYKFFFHHPETNDGKFHPLNGLYLEPLLMTGYTEKVQSYLEPAENPQDGMIIREKVMSTKYLAAFCNIGNQYILYNRFSLDFTIGLGLGTYSNRLALVNDKEYNPSYKPQRFGFMIMGGNTIFRTEINAPLAFNAGIRLGYVFK